MVDGAGGSVQKPGVNVNHSPSSPNQDKNQDNPTPDNPTIKPDDDKPIEPDKPGTNDTEVPWDNSIDFNYKGANDNVWMTISSLLLNNYNSLNLYSFDTKLMNDETLENYVKTGKIVFKPEKHGLTKVADYYLTKVTANNNDTEDTIAETILRKMKNDNEFKTKYENAFRKGNDGNASVYQDGKDFYILYAMTDHNSLIT